MLTGDCHVTPAGFLAMTWILQEQHHLLPTIMCEEHLQKKKKWGIMLEFVCVFVERNRNGKTK